MKKVIHKVFFVWDFDEEEKWLCEMAAKGLALVSVGFCRYEFEDCVPGEYKVCLDLLKDGRKSAESARYIEFIEETGAEHVGTYLRWVYFRKKAADGDFKIFSDNTSRMKYLTRIICFIAPILGLNLGAGCYNLFWYFRCGMAMNLLGIINLLIAVFGMAGLVRIFQKRKKLKLEQQIFE